ncbi:hypothetical protein Q1695_014643 [Nippostrongylus brasiliensis]|nr:hypothetical protein Q1695_014643 [Nippostrongylus brasiliensis]
MKDEHPLGNTIFLRIETSLRPVPLSFERPTYLTECKVAMSSTAMTIRPDRIGRAGKKEGGDDENVGKDAGGEEEGEDDEEDKEKDDEDRKKPKKMTKKRTTTRRTNKKRSVTRK